MTTGRRRVCLLTGASGTLGTYLCRRLARDHDVVAVTHHQHPRVPTQHQHRFDPLTPCRERAPEPSVHEIRADLTDDDEVDRVVDETVSRFGAVDLLVNAAVARIAVDLRAPSPDDLADLFHLNVVVPMMLTGALVRRCWDGARAQNLVRRRNVVNVSSTCGTLRRGPSGPLVGYGASKAALTFASADLAHELATLGVRVNVVAPTDFPAGVTVASVVREITGFDRGRTTGRIVHLTERGRSVTRPGWSPPASDRPAVGGSFAARAHATPRARLTEACWQALAQEAAKTECSTVPSEHRGYGLGDDSTYVSGSMRFRSGAPGPALEGLHRHPATVAMVRRATGDDSLVPSENLAYMYYDEGAFIDVHTDVGPCEITVLTAVLGVVPPLMAYPRLLDVPPTELLVLARGAGGRPAGGAALPVPRGGFLVLAGRRLPHRRPPVGPTDGPLVLATLCYRSGARQS